MPQKISLSKKQLGMLLFFILFFLCPQGLWAVEESRLVEAFAQEVLPFYQEQVTLGSFAGQGGIPIRYAKYEVADEQGALVLVNGRTEFLLKYAELLYDLRHSGYSLYLMDHRGQGASGRMLANPEKGYVASYNEYVADLKTFVDTVVNQTPHRRRLVLAHSMGGTISILYALQHPKDFDGLVLCAPMLEINSGLLPKWLGWPLLKVLNWGVGPESYFLGGKGYDPLKSFATNDLTASEPRFSLQKRLVAQNPQIALGSPTNGWLLASYKAMAEIAEQAPKVAVPILLLQAGNDKVVRAEGQDRFCRLAPHCQDQVITGARHELLMEKDSVRNQVLAALLGYRPPR